jgi:hypothetical protein
MIAAAILTLSGSLALAQSGSSGGMGGPANSSGASKGVSGQAPVGHLQPRRGSDGSERSIDQIDPADAALDRKIKSICRGC